MGGFMVVMGDATRTSAGTTGRPDVSADAVFEGQDRLMTPGEVAELFRVGPKTVTRWAAIGKLGSVLTPGGHHRFRESEVRQLLRTIPQPRRGRPRRQLCTEQETGQ